MNQLLRNTEIVRTVGSDEPCRVGKLLGAGGQGEVFVAELNGTAVALKWYFPTFANSEQQRALEKIIQIGAPDSRFLWPLALVQAPGVDGFGYVMPLREDRYKSFDQLMKRRIDPSFRSLTKSGFQLADSYLRLHSLGLCYRDISSGNVFLDPSSGDILICDNDNVTINNSGPGKILGTPRFTAPEVVRGEANPSTQTDLYSLSVLLFYMFMTHHPLDGRREASIRCLDLAAMNKLYGTDPLFIFDPHDDSNCPIRDYHDNALEFWPIYPNFFRELFTRAFTTGIRDPENGRVRESEWRGAMLQLQDSIFPCPHCHAENFFDAARWSSKSYEKHCWQCKRDLADPVRIAIGKSLIMLNADTELYLHHVEPTKNADLTKTVATVSRHPQKPNIWGLTNQSNVRWTYTRSDGSLASVEPGKSVTLQAGLRIHFGTSEGEILC